MQNETVIVLDFGGQYSQLIARRIREQNVYCEVLPCDTPVEVLAQKRPKGLIFTGDLRTYMPRLRRNVTARFWSSESPCLAFATACS